jgi:hypothetical protein
VIKIIIVLLATCILLYIGGCKSNTVVRRIDTTGNTPIKDFDGVPYRLPRTVVSVTVPVKLVQEQPGPFVEFAPCFFPDTPADDITTKRSRKISIETPTFDSFGEPDPTQTFIVSIKGGRFENKSLLMDFSPGGVLKKGEASSEDKSLEFALKTVQTAASIAGSVVAAKDANADGSKEADAKKCFEVTEPFVTHLRTKADADRTRYRAKMADASANRDIAAADKFQKYLEESDRFYNRFDNLLQRRPEAIDNYARASQAFNKLTQLLGRRDSMVSSPSDPSLDSLKLRIAETDKSIEAYTQLFKGISSEAAWSAVIQIRPGDSEIQYSKPFMALIPEGIESEGSGNAGICPSIGLIAEDGVRPPKKFATSQCTNAPLDQKVEIVWLRISKDNEDAVYRRKIAIINATHEKGNKERGWYFRVPAKGNLIMRKGTARLSDLRDHDFINWPAINEKATELARANMMIGQLGVVASIPKNGGGRSHKSSLELNGITGELVNFKYSSTAALEKERLGEIQSSAESIINASDPLAKKKRELEKLKTEKEIRDLNVNLAPQP